MTVFMPFQVFRWLLYTRNCNVLGRLCSSDNAYSSASEPRLLRSNTWCYLHNSKTIHQYIFSFEITVYTGSLSQGAVCAFINKEVLSLAIVKFTQNISISSRQESHKDKSLHCSVSCMIVCMLNDYKSQSNWYLCHLAWANQRSRTHFRSRLAWEPCFKQVWSVL